MNRCISTSEEVYTGRNGKGNVHCLCGSGRVLAQLRILPL